MKSKPGASDQLRLLVAGDKSQCGKSTISLGLLASLLELGFTPGDLAYIKPATQCVSATLTAKFCESAGIDYVHIGPVVFYRGFTREFLDGQHGSSEGLVERCAKAVEHIAAGKRVVLIDGVGYPTVGSIVGCSSVDIALACRARVLLVGKSGVGDAIDSFNLCAAPFEQRGVPVLGAIFNKLALTGLRRVASRLARARPARRRAHAWRAPLPRTGSYNIDTCGTYVRKYFESTRKGQRVYGLLPGSEALELLGREESCGLAFRHPNPESHVLRVEAMGEAEAATVRTIVALFKERVDVPAIVADGLAHAGASELAFSRLAAVRLLSAEPASLLRQPTALAWVIMTALLAHVLHLLVHLVRLLRLGGRGGAARS
jgi:dethiobiotin synthetase